MQKLLLIFLDKYLAWVVLKPKILFLKFLEFIKVVKYAKICIVMVSSVLRYTSQVEHTKKHNSIDSENKSVKQNAGHQNCLAVSFVTLVLSYS